MARFKQKPIFIDAIQWNGSNANAVLSLDPTIHDIFVIRNVLLRVSLAIRPEHLVLNVGDWLVKDGNNNFTVLPDEEFNLKHGPE